VAGRQGLPENAFVRSIDKKASPMSMVGFPLLLIPLAIYNIIVFLMPGVALDQPVFRLKLMSGAEWPLTSGDVLLALGILLLLFEVIKGARPGGKYLTDHLLSLIVFGGAIAEFLLWPRFGNSIYGLLALMALVDFLSGITLRTRRGARTVAASAAPRRSVRQPELPVEPGFEPMAAPPAATVAESVLRENPEPKVLQPSPEVPSPGLQPNNGAPPSPETPR
jgi:hypothetical protein